MADINKIEVKGIESLGEQEKATVNNLFDSYYIKIQRKIKSPLSLKIHIKEYNKEGKRKKYSINAEAISSGKIFKANSDDWNLTATIHEVFGKLLTQVEHKFHSSDQH